MSKIKKVAETKSFVKIPTPVALVLGLLLLASSFYSGYSWKKNQNPIAASDSKVSVFAAKKSSKPELKFFVMSFCPYGNQAEDTLRPVYDLLKDKADFTPQYIFSKIDNLASYCQTSNGDSSQCATYVQNGYFTSEAQCQQTIADSIKTCNDQSNYIKADNGTMYSSLHGRVEANQNVREICAWKLSEDKTQWWDFLDNVNQNCTDKNADTCWEAQAKAAGLDSVKITECFNNEAIDLIEKEMVITDKYDVSGSPTFLINEVPFPPEDAYTQDGKGVLKIGKKTATQDRFRTPNVIKEALCTSFDKTPSECKEELPDLTGQTVPQGGC